MATSAFAENVTAFAGLVTAVAWPSLIAGILYSIGPELKKFAFNLGEINIEGAGFKALLKKSQTEAAAALSAAAAVSSKSEEQSVNNAETRKAVKLATQTITKQLLEKTRNSEVLWVDDTPSNNHYESEALRALGLAIDTATSTDEAMQLIERNHYDLVISDMGRPGDSRAGLTLLEILRNSGDTTPYVIYASTRALALRDEAIRIGAIDCTNRPDQLFKLVSNTLARPN